MSVAVTHYGTDDAGKVTHHSTAPTLARVALGCRIRVLPVQGSLKNLTASVSPTSLPARALEGQPLHCATDYNIP